MQRRMGRDGLWETGRGRGATHPWNIDGLQTRAKRLKQRLTCPELGPRPLQSEQP